MLPGPVVSAGWLSANLDSIQVVDVRWSIDDGPRHAAFQLGHLPGAVFADLDADLSGPPGARGRHPLPTPEHFAEVRARLGLGSRPVVAYDDQCGAVAGRLWWMLEAVGHPAAVLDGGIGAWQGPLETGPGGDPAEGRPAAVPWPETAFIDVDDVIDAIEQGAVLLDARSLGRYRGDPNPIDGRLGHIPGARSRPWTDNVGPDGRLLPIESLRAAYAGLGVDHRTNLIASCGSGVTGCHDLLVARLLGFPDGRLYTGSWSEWAADAGRPVVTGTEPGVDAGT
jgi:thiosulfate/3-mercaptopyruvate sulfurtransferase